MTFNEIRQNLQVYVLIKGDELVYAQGKVINKGQPRINTQSTNGQNMMMGVTMPSMVIDVTLELNGQTNTYPLPQNASVAAIGNTLISLSKDDILNELHATESQCDEYLAGVEKTKKRKAKCVALLAELDTAFKEKQDITRRIDDLQEKYNDIVNGQNEILQILKDNRS